MQEFNGCVIGYPLGHSKSPLIHNRWLRRYGINGRYEARPVTPEQLAVEGRGVFAGYDGLNVTLPHKERVIPFCDRLDPVAAAIGAVNTIAREADRSLTGYNTDAYGFVANIDAALPGFDWANRPTLILGAGGAAKAAAQALKARGVPKVTVVNRDPARAQALADAFGVEAAPWDEASRRIAGMGLVVNATSLGMTGQPSLDCDLSALPREAAVCDMVYQPLLTPLLEQARDRGNPVVTGIGMLMHQAAMAFRIWTGVMPEVDDALERALLEA